MTTIELLTLTLIPQHLSSLTSFHLPFRWGWAHGLWTSAEPQLLTLLVPPMIILKIFITLSVSFSLGEEVEKFLFLVIIFSFSSKKNERFLAFLLFCDWAKTH